MASRFVVKPLRLQDADEEMDSYIEDVAENDEIGQYVDLSRFNKDGLKKLKGTTLRHFNKCLKNDNFKTVCPQYAHINSYKERVDERPRDEVACLAKTSVIGIYADYLMKTTNIKMATCLAYLSGMKTMLCEDFPHVLELQQPSWYRKTRANVFSG